jgi:hypothetical protein
VFLGSVIPGSVVLDSVSESIVSSVY